MEYSSILDGPYLASVNPSIDDTVDWTSYPFSLPLIKKLPALEFPNQVTFFVGENGSGKSTLLEAIAHNAGFGSEGGSKNIQFKTADQKYSSATESLAKYLRLSWRKKPRNGYFFRAESFFAVANYLDAVVPSALQYYGGKSLHEQSHGEGFLSFFNNRLGSRGFFIFDEPEAALSPQRQLSLLCIINKVCRDPHSQFIIATHSPILLAYPNATIYSCDGDTLSQISYKDTDHYLTTKHFLDDPDRYLHHLFKD